jgi:hypothetical protein
MKIKVNMTGLYQCPVPKGWYGFCLAVADNFPSQKPCQNGFTNNSFRIVGFGEWRRLFPNLLLTTTKNFE